MTTYYMLGAFFGTSVTGIKAINYYNGSQKSTLTVAYLGFLGCNIIYQPSLYI